MEQKEVIFQVLGGRDRQERRQAGEETGRRGTCGSAGSMGPWENVYKIVVPGMW